LNRKFCIYFDDIFVYNCSLSEHLEHLKQILLIVRKNHLFANVDKCNF